MDPLFLREKIETLRSQRPQQPPHNPRSPGEAPAFSPEAPTTIFSRLLRTSAGTAALSSNPDPLPQTHRVIKPTCAIFLWVPPEHSHLRSSSEVTPEAPFLLTPRVQTAAQSWGFWDPKRAIHMATSSWPALFRASLMCPRDLKLLPPRSSRLSLGPAHPWSARQPESPSEAKPVNTFPLAPGGREPAFLGRACQAPGLPASAPLFCSPPVPPPSHRPQLAGAVSSRNPLALPGSLCLLALPEQEYHLIITHPSSRASHAVTGTPPHVPVAP